MKKRLIILAAIIMASYSFIYPWTSQLFPFNGGTGKYQTTPVSFDSKTWQLLDYSYVGYNLGQTPLQTGVPCNVLTVAGTGDITQELQQKINTVGAAGGGIVKIPAGNYTITSADMGTGSGQRTICINYNNVSVEGAGSGYTIINVPSTHSYDENSNTFEGTFCIEQGYFVWNKGWTDPSGLLCTVNNKINSGDTYITGISDLSAVNTGDWILIIQYFWTALVNNNAVSGAWNSCTGNCSGNPQREYAFSYLRKIVAKDASGITVDAPIPYTLDPANNQINVKNPGVATGSMVQNSGVSGMTIKFADNNNSTTTSLPSGCGVYFEAALNCWAKDINVVNFPRYGICAEYSARVTVEDCYVKKAQNYGGGGWGYAFRNTATQNALFKNCVSENVRHGFITERAITNYVAFTHCMSINSQQGEDTHFSLAHAILRDDYFQSNGNDLNGYNRGGTSGGAYESYLSGAMWNVAGDGYSGIYYGGTINITPSNDGSAIIVGGPGNHTVYDGSYYDTGGTYHPGDIMPVNSGLQVGTGPNGTRKNVLYEGLGSTGLQPQSLYVQQLLNRVGTVAEWANVCGDAPTLTPMPTNTPVLTPGILVYDGDHPAWGAGYGGSALTPVCTLTPGNSLYDKGQNRTINGAYASRFAPTGGDYGILMTYGGPSCLTSNINKLDFWIYPVNAGMNFRLQLMRGVPLADVGSSLIVTGAMADGGVFTANAWNHVSIPIASFGYSGTFNGLGLSNNTSTAGNTFWLDDIYFITNAIPSFTNTPSSTFTYTRTATQTYTRTFTTTPAITATNTVVQTPTFTATTGSKWGACNKILLAYYYNDGTRPYNASKIPYNKLTNICHSFVVPNADGSLSYPAGFLEPALISGAHAAGVKVNISIGGGGTYAQCSAMAGNATARNTFENNMVAFIQANGYDGIDIDWEGMTSPADTAGYTALITELRVKFNAAEPPGSSWLISAAVPMTNYYGQWIDYPSIVSSVDFFNLMDYDQHGGWSDHMGYNEALYANPSDPDAMSSVMGVDYMVVTRNVPASKVVMGVPFYGYDFVNISTPFASCGGSCGDANVVSLDYNTVAAGYLNNGWTYHWDAVSHVPYLTKNTGTGIITYDDPQSITDKVNYALTARNLGGVMMWDLSGDYIPWQGQPLMDAMYNTFMQACPSGYTATPTFTISPTYTSTPVWPSAIIYDGDTAGAKITDGVITNSANGGGLTQVAGGNPGNGMLVTYVDSAWYSSHTWQLNSPKNLAGYNYLQFDIKSTAGFVDDFNLLMDWTKGAVNVSNYSSIGVPPYWITIQIPLSDLLMPADTQVTFIAFQKLINYPYTLMMDNIKLVNIATPTASPTQQPNTPTFTYTRTATNTPQASLTATATYTRTSTSTGTLTATNTPDPADTMTRTNTATPVITSTSSVTPTDTTAQTPTYSPTETPYEGTPTGTYTTTPTFTRTPYFSPTYTNTPQDTITDTPADTATDTPANTATYTPTQTIPPSATNTPVNTASTTPHDTFSPTPQPFTPTNTGTMVPTATTTPTPAAVPAAQELKPYPNPVNPLVQDLLIAVNVESLSAEISFKAYTTALRLVRHIKLGTMSQGVKVCTIARDALKDLSNGVYFCVIEQQGNDKKTSRSKTVKIIILK
jgi:chitinase